jgi:hypothetical protein
MWGTLYFVGCIEGFVFITRYFQLVPRGIWYVECLCDCSEDAYI